MSGYLEIAVKTNATNDVIFRDVKKYKRVATAEAAAMIFVSDYMANVGNCGGSFANLRLTRLITEYYTIVIRVSTNKQEEIKEFYPICD